MWAGCTLPSALSHERSKWPCAWMETGKERTIGGGGDCRGAAGFGSCRQLRVERAALACGRLLPGALGRGPAQHAHAHRLCLRPHTHLCIHEMDALSTITFKPSLWKNLPQCLNSQDFPTVEWPAQLQPGAFASALTLTCTHMNGCIAHDFQADQARCFGGSCLNASIAKTAQHCE